MRPDTTLQGLLFESAADAQRAFYDAFQQRNIEDMMLVWDNSEDIICVHPGGPKLCGTKAVRDSWEQIFSQEMDWNFRLSNGQCMEGELLSVHQVEENIYEQERLQGRVIATNVFLNTPRGWRMFIHHASPTPQTALPTLSPCRNLH